MEPYIVLTPFGDHKHYALKEFIRSLNKLRPQPEMKIICADLDTKYKDELESYDLVVYYSPEIFSPPSYLERICMSREILRKKFIYSNYEWSLWIDSDIIVPPDTPRILYKIAKDSNCLVVSNGYPGSYGHEHEIWHGSGVMLTNKLACTGSRFWVADFNGKHLSEDFVFLSILDQGSYFIEQYTGRKARIVGEFVKVKHLSHKHSH